MANLLCGTGTVVKGRRNLEIRFGLATTRASTDVDIVRVQELEEAGGMQATDMIVSADGAGTFEAVGLPAPGPVTVLTLPMQVAQKLHACTATDTVDWINDRAHDLIDLQLIDLDLNDSQLPEVREACERLFQARTGHDWPPTVTARQGWSVRYSEERADVEAHVHEDLDRAVAWANEFIAQVAEA